MSAAVGQIETKLTQIGPVEFGRWGWGGGVNIAYGEKQRTRCIMIILSSALQTASTKIGVIVICELDTLEK